MRATGELAGDALMLHKSRKHAGGRCTLISRHSSACILLTPEALACVSDHGCSELLVAAVLFLNLSWRLTEEQELVASENRTVTPFLRKNVALE